MFTLKFRSDNTYILTMLARYPKWEGEGSREKPWLTSYGKLSMIAGLSVPDLLLMPDSPLRSQANLRKFRKDIESMKHDPKSIQILQEAVAFRLTVQSQWIRNRKQIDYELRKMLRIPIPRDPVEVFITHPRIPVGHAIPRLRIICWGHQEEFRNYHSVFLAHELLHYMLPPDEREVDHALIELIADDELRMKLNGSGRYFQYPGHERLRRLKKKLLPYWRRYLHRRTGTILTFLKDCRKVV